MPPLLIKHCNCLVKAHFTCISKFFAQHIQCILRTYICNRIETKAEFFLNLISYLIGIYRAKIPHSKLIISFEFAILKVILFETVTQISRSINPDVFVDNMKRNSDPWNTWSSCVTMLKRQTRVKGAVRLT